MSRYNQMSSWRGHEQFKYKVKKNNNEQKPTNEQKFKKTQRRKDNCDLGQVDMRSSGGFPHPQSFTDDMHSLQYRYFCH